MSKNLGPTVSEATEAAIRHIDAQIEELREKRRILELRRCEYAKSSMLESERIANTAEKHLPEIQKNA